MMSSCDPSGLWCDAGGIANVLRCQFSVPPGTESVIMTQNRPIKFSVGPNAVVFFWRCSYQARSYGVLRQMSANQSNSRFRSRKLALVPFIVESRKTQTSVVEESLRTLARELAMEMVLMRALQ